MRYSLLAGGKRVRPVLCLASARSAGAEPGVGAARRRRRSSSIHTYSLIHDDLPAMDDDELRRGRPTSHVKFGEDVAILAGDGLFAEAINLFLSEQEGEPANVSRRAARLAGATGVERHGRRPVHRTSTASDEVDAEALRELHALQDGPPDRRERPGPAAPRGRARGCHNLRTGASPKSSACCSRSSTTSSTSPGSDAELGKPHGSDERHGKLTYVSLFGLERARELAADSHAQARAALAAIDGDTADLELITDFIHTRQA